MLKWRYVMNSGEVELCVMYNTEVGIQRIVLKLRMMM